MRKTTLITLKKGKTSKGKPDEIPASFDEENDFMCRLWLKKHRHRKMRSRMAIMARRRNREK